MSVLVEVTFPLALPLSLTYLAEEAPVLGGRVVAPLAGRRRVGVVTGFPPEAPPAALRAVERVLDEVPVVPEEALGFLRWVAGYHLAPLGRVLRAALPRRLFRLREEGFGGPLAPFRPGQGFSPLLLHEEEEGARRRFLLRLAREALSVGGQALLLLPERAEAERWAAEAEGELPVRLYHGGLSPRRLAQVWREVLRGEPVLVLGTRRAVFLPLRRPALVAVEGEEDEGYKEEQAVRYQARDLALMRAKMEGTRAVLASPAPSVKSYFLARRGRYGFVPGKRVGPERLDVVDLSRERGLLSRRLVNACRLTLARGRQVFLFLNRLGYAPVLQCQDCGHVWRCPRCETPLSYHREEGELRCHLCRYRLPAPPLCPDCGGGELRFLGAGTERLLEVVSRLFPAARVARLDQETAAGEWDFAEIDVLVGTRKAGWRVPLPRLGLIGVVLADQLLCLPRFQAAERAYALLKRLSLNPCPWFVVQTFHPAHHVFRGLRLGYEHFCAVELEHRRRLGYPPFSRLAALSWAGRRREAVLARAEEVLSCLEGKGLEVLGPREERRRGLARVELVVRGDHRALHQALAFCLAGREGGGVKFSLDLDPD